MSTYKNPPILNIDAPVNVDAEIQRIQTEISALTWLDRSFGKAELARTKEGGEERLYPEVFTGEKRNPYQNVLPNNKLKSQSFFRVNEPLSNVSPGGMFEQNTYELNLSLIFWFDLQRIKTLAPYSDIQDYRFTEVLLAEVLQVLRNIGVKTTGVYYTPEQVFAGYTINHLDDQTLKEPYSGFRIDFTTAFLEQCTDQISGFPVSEITVVGDEQEQGAELDPITATTDHPVTFYLGGNSTGLTLEQTSPTEAVITGTATEETDAVIIARGTFGGIVGYHLLIGVIYPIEISINGDTYQEQVEEDIDIPVINSADEPVGTIDGVNVEVSDSEVAITVNGTPAVTKAVKAEGSASQNIVVEDTLQNPIGNVSPGVNPGVSIPNSGAFMQINGGSVFPFLTVRAAATASRDLVVKNSADEPVGAWDGTDIDIDDTALTIELEGTPVDALSIPAERAASVEIADYVDLTTPFEVNGVTEGTIENQEVTGVDIVDEDDVEIEPVSVSVVGNKRKIVLPNSIEPPEAWVRPVDWLALPEVLITENKFVALHAIYENGDNFAAFIFQTSTFNQYQVDWGDGVVEVVTDGVKAQHAYNFATYDVGNTTLTSDGYKQAIITVTPYVDGYFHVCDLLQRHSLANQVYSTGFLDCTLSMPGANPASSIFIGGISPVRHTKVERFTIKTTGTYQNFLSFFNSCYSLQSVPLWDTVNASTMNSMFASCYALKEVPLFNTVNVSAMSSMFSGCYTLKSVPLFNTANVLLTSSMFLNCYSLQTVPLFNMTSNTTMASMFQNCYSLKEVPLFNTPVVNSMALMFSGCGALKEVPLFNTANVALMGSMFISCLSLLRVPLFNTANVTSMVSMFQTCYNLIEVPLFNTANVTTMASMFTNCFSLKTVPLFNTIKVTTMANMFQNCNSLEKVPLFNTVAVTTMDSMFNGCHSLEAVPTFDTANVTTMATMFQTCHSIKHIPAFNTAKITIALGTNYGNWNNSPSISSIKIAFARQVNLSSCGLGAAALLEIFTNLAARGTSGAAIITITSNFGADTAISKTLCGTTIGSAVVTQANTSSLVVGMLVTGTGINTARAVTFTDVGDLVNLTAHGLVNGNIVSFATIVTTTGIVIFTPYYVVNAAADNFQLSLTLGGSAIPLTSNGSGTINFGSFIVSINPNVSFTLDKPASANGSVTLSARVLDTSIATLKGWTVTG